MKLFHVVEIHPQPEDARKKFAADSWRVLYDRGEMIPVHYNDYVRDARTSIGDKRDLPFLKDVLGMAMDLAEPEDIIAFTNDDNTLHTSAPTLIKEYVRQYKAVAWRRCEFRPGHHPALDAPISEWSMKSLGHIGHDLFAFTKEWLTDNWNELPDFILGASEWDLGLALMIRRYHKIKSTRIDISQNVFPAEPPQGPVGHENHVSHWMEGHNKESAPSQKHNRNLVRAWMTSYLPSLEFDKSFTQITEHGVIVPQERPGGIVNRIVRPRPRVVYA